MSHNHCIRISLDLKDKNISFDSNFCEEQLIKGVKSKVYKGILTYNPSACPCCGIKNEQFAIVKNGFMSSRIKWLSVAHYPTYILLKKQRFLCRHCHSSFLAESSEIEKHCFIAKRVKQSILVELSDAISFKDLSKRHFVSPTTINRVLVSGGRDLSNRFLQLPQNLCFDEFTSVKNNSGKYSFIYSDSATHEIIDILIDNKKLTLEKHFLKYSLRVRRQVKTIVVDMNAAYFKLAKKLFPNASVIIDRFHLVQLISRSLNITRIKTMNHYRTSNLTDMKNYRKLKKYWKLFLKDSNELNYRDYRYQRLFKSMLPETDVMDYLLSLNKELSETYKLYQELLYCSKNNDFETFSDLLLLGNEHVSTSMGVSIRTLKKHLPRIKNTFKYTHSNGSLEGSINKIKL
ncbi:ISL3 family transposase, partial [Enterococcus faecalis]|nr:ISL3 family transposase [Enterococcus faecalis]